MKVYWRDGNKLYTAEVEDGAVCISLNQRPVDQDLPPIKAIHWGNKTFRREGMPDEPFPEKWYALSDVKWKEVA